MAIVIAKKFLLILCISLGFFILFSGAVKAATGACYQNNSDTAENCQILTEQECEMSVGVFNGEPVPGFYSGDNTVCPGQQAPLCDESEGGTKGLVPCGRDPGETAWRVIGKRTIQVERGGNNDTWNITLVVDIGNAGASEEQLNASAVNQCKAARPGSTNVTAPSHTGFDYTCSGRLAVTTEDQTETRQDIIYADTAQLAAQNFLQRYNIDQRPNVTTTVTKIGSVPKCPCQLGHVFILTQNIYKFILFDIATPLAGLLILIGGVMLIVSAGNPNLAAMGKNIIKWALIALALMFAAWLIVDIILKAIGYTQSWFSF